MKPLTPIPLLFLLATSTLSLPLNTTLPLTSNLPHPSFKIRTTLLSPLLPADAALMNVLFFLGLTSIQHPTEELPPRTYSAPGYRQIEITSYAWTETRFLLWGVYLAVVDMVKNVRFHDMIINLYWEEKMVGRMKIGAKKSVLSLPSGDYPGRVLEEDSPSSSIDSLTNRTHSPPDRRIIDHSANLLNLWQSTNTSTPASTATSPLTATDISIEFQPVASATLLGRNDVFLTFFGALLHVAQFSPQEEIETFDSKSPFENVYMYMYKSETSCQYGRATNILTYVPKYMLENPAFGYKETQFQAKIFGMQACKGTLFKSLLP